MVKDGGLYQLESMRSSNFATVTDGLSVTLISSGITLLTLSLYKFSDVFSLFPACLFGACELVSTILLCYFDESSMPFKRPAMTLAYLMQTVAVLIGVYRPFDRKKHLFWDGELFAHIGATLYAISWMIDLANFFMTAYEIVPLTTALNVDYQKF